MSVPLNTVSSLDGNQFVVSDVIRRLVGLDSNGQHFIVDPAVPEPLGRVELVDIPGRWGRMDTFGRPRNAAD
jgi:hypothetical protein